MCRRPAILIVIFSLGVLAAMQPAKQIFRIGPDLKLPFSPAVKAGNLLYVSGAVAADDSGRIIEGDLKAQTKRILDSLARLLEAAGCGIENAAWVHVYLKNAADFASMNEVYRAYWSAAPPARTTVAGDMVIPGALVEISMVAIPQGRERRVVHPADWLKSPNPYSYGILSGDTLFMSGLVARNLKSNAPVPGDIRSQVRVVMDNAGAILEAAGMSYADVVSSRVFITDTALFQDMNAVYRSYFAQDPPARATVRAGLMSPQDKVEITLLAVKGGQRTVITTPNADGTAGKPNPNFSSAIRVGNRLYLAGMMGLDGSNEADMGSQTRETLGRIGRTLKAAGFDWPHVVDAVVYITDVGKFGDMNRAYRAAFSADFPARATVETGLVSPDGLVEIMMTAVK